VLAETRLKRDPQKMRSELKFVLNATPSSLVNRNLLSVAEERRNSRKNTAWNKRESKSSKRLEGSPLTFICAWVKIPAQIKIREWEVESSKWKDKAKDKFKEQRQKQKTKKNKDINPMIIKMGI